jgi:hypothetical protein
MILFVWFGDTKKAMIAAIVMGNLTLIALSVAGAIGINTALKTNTWEPASAVVTDFDTRDGTNVWTDLSYEYDHQHYTTRTKGHSYWMKIDREITILVNPKNPEKFEIINPTDGKVASSYVAVVFLFAAGLFGAVFLLWLLNYLGNKRRDRKLAQQ